jgi:hypothetical protein
MPRPMKTLLLALTLITISFASCKKDKVDCYVKYGEFVGQPTYFEVPVCQYKSAKQAEKETNADFCLER